ncbi:MAG TPA: GspMb/PilO family protein [Opitutaceae bacterium]|nr:GspMb/PilO family protein [Opitutaceae bacterium]
MSISNEQLVAFIKKNPIGVGCGVLSLALAGAAYYRADLIPAASAEMDQKGALSDRLAANLKYGKDLPEQMQQFTEDNKAINSRLVSAADILANNQYFYNLETVTSTKIGQTQITTVAQARAAKGNFVPINFNLNVTGTYPQLLDFLGRLENGLHFARVLNSRVSKAVGAAATANPDLLTMTLSVDLLGQP